MYCSTHSISPGNGHSFMGTGIVGFQRFVPGLQTMKSHHRAFRPQPGRTARFFSGWKAQRAGLEKPWREMPAVYGLINNTK